MGVCCLSHDIHIFVKANTHSRGVWSGNARSFCVRPERRIWCSLHLFLHETAGTSSRVIIDGRRASIQRKVQERALIETTCNPGHAFATWSLTVNFCRTVGLVRTSRNPDG